MGTSVAKYYPEFNDFYEEERKKVNKDLEQAARVKPVYEAVKRALELTKDDYPQKFKIYRYGTYLTVKATLLKDQHYTDFLPLANAIRDELRRSGLRDLELPNALLTSQVSWHYYAKVTNSDKLEDLFKVILSLECDLEGNKFRTVKHRQVTSVETVTDYNWLDRPSPDFELDPDVDVLDTETIRRMYDNVRKQIL